MKKILVALLALAAVAPLAAGTLADFGGEKKLAVVAVPSESMYGTKVEGLDREVTTVASKKYLVEAPEVAVVEDAAAPNGKALRAKISDRKEGVKFARFDVVVKFTAEEAAKIREISFDVKVSDRKAFGWSMLYFAKERRTTDCIKQPIPNSKKFKIGEWQHFAFPVSEFKPEGKGIAMTDARQFIITFFTQGPLEIGVANIGFAE